MCSFECELGELGAREYQHGPTRSDPKCGFFSISFGCRPSFVGHLHARDRSGSWSNESYNLRVRRMIGGATKLVIRARFPRQSAAELAPFRARSTSVVADA